MKKTLIISTLVISSLFIGCQNGQTNYTGCWKGEADMIFEVLQNGANDGYIIRNINGDLDATIQENKICGKNSLDMQYCMSVKGDSAYYEFGGITTGYIRITKSEYETIYSNQKAASAMQFPIEQAAEQAEQTADSVKAD